MQLPLCYRVTSVVVAVLLAAPRVQQRQEQTVVRPLAKSGTAVVLVPTVAATAVTPARLVRHMVLLVRRHRHTQPCTAMAVAVAVVVQR